MASKYDIAQYLVNLHTLLQAQDSAGGLLKSGTLAAEYETNWGLLKDTINKENEDETRKRDNDRQRPEAGADRSRDQPGRRL